MERKLLDVEQDPSARCPTLAGYEQSSVSYSEKNPFTYEAG